MNDEWVPIAAAIESIWARAKGLDTTPGSPEHARKKLLGMLHLGLIAESRPARPLKSQIVGGLIALLPDEEDIEALKSGEDDARWRSAQFATGSFLLERRGFSLKAAHDTLLAWPPYTEDDNSIFTPRFKALMSGLGWHYAVSDGPHFVSYHPGG